MTPKDKARDIFVKIYETIPNDVIPEDNVARELAKQHALICVDEILNNPHKYMFKDGERLHDEFWNSVKEEINNL